MNSAKVAQAMSHRHSTLFGVAATVVLILAIGEVSHWSPALMTVIGLLGIAVFPRLFYGFAAARALDKERASAAADSGSRFINTMWYGRPTEEERLERAIEAAEGFGPQIGPDTSALERLAQEEGHSAK